LDISSEINRNFIGIRFLESAYDAGL